MYPLNPPLAGPGGNEDIRDTLCFFRRESAHSNAASWNFLQLNYEELLVIEKLKDLLNLMPYISENAKKYYRNLKFCADCEEIL